MSQFPCRICGSSAPGQIIHEFEDNIHRVLACHQCQAETILPYPSPDELREFYGNYHNTRTPDEHLPLLTKHSTLLLESLFTRAGISGKKLATMHYMEIGFGNGASLLAAAKLGMKAHGVDLDPENVRDVSRRAQQLELTVSCQCRDALSAFSEGENCEFVKSSQVIEHLVDPAGFIASIARNQNPGGLLFLECPNNSATFLGIKNRLRKRFSRMNFYNSMKISEHLWGFNRRSMTELLARNGYDVVFCRDYYVRHPFFQPENLLWYPELREGILRSVKSRRSYHFLKSLIPLFDMVASRIASGGIGLAVLARRTQEPVRSQ